MGLKNLKSAYNNLSKNILFRETKIAKTKELQESSTNEDKTIKKNNVDVLKLRKQGSLALDAKVKETQDLIQNRETNARFTLGGPASPSTNDITNPLLSGIDYSRRMLLGFASGNLGDNVTRYAEDLIDKALDFSIDLPTGNNPASKFLFSEAQQVVDETKLRVILEAADFGQLPVVGRVTPFIDLGNKPGKTKYIDKVSLHPALTSESDDRIAPTKKGDFYVKIKDLRNNGFIYFRGFVTGITENVSPSFTPVNYIGRSEAVYMYERAERDISFNLKIHPANLIEQKLMYDKLEKLTSLAYPEYALDENLDSQTRMKPPFTELYMAHIGTRKKGQFGFIKSISYTVPGESDWDALRVLPRLFDINISYQILSKKPPHMKSNFYGA